jgi:hypothetical protein
VRRIRAGRVLIELASKVMAAEVAYNLKIVTWQGTKIVKNRDWNALESGYVDGLLPLKVWLEKIEEV